MNDPGLEDSLQSSYKKAAFHVKGNASRSRSSGASSGTSARQQGAAGTLGVRAAFREELREDEEEEEVGYFQPKRWWFTSTAFPLVAGTFGPLANFFSICAQCFRWREESSSHGLSPTPTWFNAMTGLSLAFSLLANIILLANFLHILRYSISQWLTISFWYISALLLIIPLGLSRHVLDAPGTDYTQSFYYAIIASVLYVILPSLLALNALGAYKFKAYAPSFNPLTIPQRTLMAQTLAYVLYIAGGAAVFARVEGWNYLDGVYWAEYTLLTIGLGSDFPPKTHLGRALLIPYAVGGITVIGLIVGSIRGLIIERGGVKLVRRTVEEERQKWISRMGEPDERWKKDEWDAMRRIKRRAESMRRWSALASSALAFFFLWLLGALVFWFAESAQEWTYFQSLYFSYTSLLTIGYGDFYPQSNAGKPFFVVWSLMAVPTVTILISNVGEILIGLVRRALMMAVFSTAAAGADKNNKKSDDERKMGADLEHLGEAVEQSERQRGLGGGLAARLSREVARLAQDAMSGTEAEYSWEDWQGWLELLGERTDAEGRGENEEKQGEWTWLGEEGPLLSGMSETQWILQRLCERLQQVLEEEYGSKR